ncbi:hypothetical protein [Streptomyces sp. GESEQ-35]|uniref:hypothetical protein n=1 Tax=Streptomyces sp. GESEQ-35 TaxID=2812657 RepID=UPI001B3306D3|nr:hypothetical protein [Streptomyces sp. GESEQ-35]
MEAILTGRCKRFSVVPVFGPRAGAFVAEVGAVRGDPAQAVDRDELGSPGDVPTGVRDEQRAPP